MSSKKNNRKAEMSNEVIIAMIIGLIVLVVLIVIFGKTSLSSQQKTEGIANKLTCAGNTGYSCVNGNTCADGQEKKSFFCGLDSICCGPKTTQTAPAAQTP